MQNTELRPLGAGEMLDRAITLYVRRFAAIVAVLAVISVPIVLLQAILTPHAGQVFSDFGRLLSAAGNSTATREAADAITRDNHTGPATILVVLLSSVLRVLMWCALVTVLAAAYVGGQRSLGEAYRFALRRWLPMLLVSLTFLVLGGFAALPILILYLIVALAIFALAALHQTIALVLVAVVGVLVVIALACVAGALVFMAYELSAVALMTETSSPVEAIGIGLRRAFAAGMKRRTLVAGLVVLLVSQAGALPLIGLAAVVTATTHIDAFYFAILGVGGVLLDGILAAFVVVYAFDVRVRREGYDLALTATP